MNPVKILLTLCLLVTAISCGRDKMDTNRESKAESDNTIILDHESLSDQAHRESLIPVRPGEPGISPFWNVNATRFMYVPSFGFEEIDKAISYKFIVYSEVDSSEYVFESIKPWTPLKPVWLDIPVGYVELKVEGLDCEKNVIGVAGTRRFYKASPYKGPYHEPVTDYQTSAKQALAYLFNKSWLQNWITDGTPDKTYSLYCYPSKMIGSIIHGMLLYAELAPEHKERAILIASNAADYLISVSEPADAPLPYLPPTYDPEHIIPENMVENDSNWEFAMNAANKYAGQIMMTYPPQVANSYLRLFDTTGDSLYYQAAVNIADTYKSIQEKKGRWPLKLFLESGKPAYDNFADPTSILEMLTTLRDNYGIKDYDRAISLAKETVKENYQRFNFEGQFEDVEPSKLYENLSHYPARNAVDYYLNLPDNRDDNIAHALEYIRFAEDQFVVWENPIPKPNLEEEWTWQSDKWITPCALEQYTCYVAIDASSTSFIPTFFTLYKATGDKLFLAKAIALANSMTVAQNAETGMYPTWWASRDDTGWINCAISSAIIMNEFGNNIARLNIEYK